MSDCGIPNFLRSSVISGKDILPMYIIDIHDAMEKFLEVGF